MQEVHEIAQKSLANLLATQQQKYIQTSQNVADQFIKLHAEAQQKSIISDEIIHDLDHQIRALEELERSGVIIEQKMKKDVRMFKEQYSAVRDQMLKNNSLDFTKKQRVTSETKDEFSKDSEVESNQYYPMLKEQKSELNQKIIQKVSMGMKRNITRGLELLNLGMLFVLALYLCYRLFK